MPRLPVTVSKFPPGVGVINGQRTWYVCQLRLELAVISVGLQSLATAFSSASAIQLTLGKAFMVSSSCEWNSKPLVTPKSFRKLDPSEKANLSYWLGMSFAQIAANRILSIPGLYHAAGNTGNIQKLQQVSPSGVITVRKSLADLIGRDPVGNWHVFEARGYAKGPGSLTLSKWKNQAQTITAINGVNITSSSWCMVITGGTYSLEIEDPDVSHLPMFAVELDVELALRKKLAVVNTFLDETETFDFGDGLVRAGHAGYDARSGLNVLIGLASKRADLVIIETDSVTLVDAEGLALTYRCERQSSSALQNLERLKREALLEMRSLRRERLDLEKV